ncbi:glycosyl transferase, group 1 [Actinokineospora spheciospongiae]|uniref:Glycosyl transferase, group 1 n=1 Tax=Actinokineospora spheciospongiae TaxID=909613 RepID=W7IYV6_9PSEU|nr:glycosyltransferase family 4 protein [Actinokineospora spheciospongiae]EWC59214.1 glycosyl transferase, group 1 [Actinokineospora spheciospongiae]
MTRRLRVAHLLTQDRGGPVDVTLDLAAALLATGEADVRVFGPPPARGTDVIAGHHEAVDLPRKGDLAAGLRVRDALLAWQPDVVHAQDRRAGLVAASLRRRLPVAHTYHGVPDDVGEPWFRRQSGALGPSAYTRVVLTADSALTRALDRTVVPSPTMARFLRDRLRVPAERITHIDNCVRLPESSPPTDPVRRLVFAGLLVERKGLLDLLEALATPGTMPAGATLTVVGDGPQRQTAQRRARRRDLAGRVQFLGFRADVPRLLREHDALVQPSRMEQQPLVVAAAMAAGKPVLATDTGGVADMLAVPGAVSYLAEPGNVADLARVLRALFADSDPGRTGRLLAARARERFAPEVCADRHLALYGELLRSREDRGQPVPVRERERS